MTDYKIGIQIFETKKLYKRIRGVIMVVKLIKMNQKKRNENFELNNSLKHS